MSADWPLSTEGGCLCGALRFRLSAAPFDVAYCHCADCRRSSAAPVSLFVEVHEESFEITKGTPAVYPSSPGVARSYCRDCGTPLSYQAERYTGERHLLIGTFDQPERFPPTRHVFTAEALPWFHIADELPRRR